MNENRHIAEAALDRDYERAVLITLIAVDGSSYRRRGARMLITDRGRSFGAVSGGCLETALREHAQRILESDEPQLIDLDTTADTDILFGHGLGCPAKLRFLFQPFEAARPLDVFEKIHAALALRQPQSIEASVGGAVIFEEVLLPPLRLVVAGAGNDARPLIRLARDLGWQTILVDSREAIATAERFPEVDRIVHVRPEGLLETVDVDARTAVVLATHHYVLDLEFLRALGGTPVPYIGVIGSRNRLQSILRELEQEGTPLARGRVFGPAGLDIGSETPAEIALAVIAEVKAVLEQRTAVNLRDKSSTEALKPT